jgi:hypothetical protein
MVPKFKKLLQKFLIFAPDSTNLVNFGKTAFISKFWIGKTGIAPTH